MIRVHDLFAGAGGSSTGIAALPGVRVILAANHWQLAAEAYARSRATSDPQAEHDPIRVTALHMAASIALSEAPRTPEDIADRARVFEDYLREERP